MILGGTVDITCHEILSSAEVKEIAPPSGGPWGGIKVDAKFVTFLERIFGKDIIQKFTINFPQQWFQLMTYFEKAKRSVKPDGTSSMKISAPYSLDQELVKSTGKTIAKTIKACPISGFLFTNGFLVVQHDRVKDLFKETTTNITDHVRSQLKDPKLARLKYILLVGGFGECAFIQKACEDAFPSHQLLVPMEAQLAVIKGAVMFGHSPSEITSRIAKMTYGLHVNVAFVEGLHDPQRAFYSWHGAKLCQNGFQVVVRKGEEVKTGSTKKFMFQPNGPYKTSENFDFYQTEKEHVLYIDEPGVSKICTMVLRSPKGPLSLQLDTLLTFGHTELLFYARDVSKGEAYPLKCSIDFSLG